jgi:hypothetical protein
LVVARSDAYLAEAQRLSHTGSFGWDVSSGKLYWSEETFRILNAPGRSADNRVRAPTNSSSRQIPRSTNN